MAEIKEAMPAPQPEALDMPDDEVLYELADLFRVFGDSTRIKILYALHDNELCVQDIANAVQLSQSAVSHQLRVLKDSKLVRFRREGKTVYYALDDDHVRKAGITYEEELQDRSGLRKLRSEDGRRCQHRCRRGKCYRQLYDPEDEGGVL